MWGLAYQVCSNEDPKLTLTYLTSRSHLLPNAIKWEFFEKLILSSPEQNNSIGNKLLDIKLTIGEYQSVVRNIRKEEVVLA